MKQRTTRRRHRGDGGGKDRMTGADGVSVLPGALAVALVVAGVAINRSVRKSRAAAQRLSAKAAASSAAARTGTGTGKGQDTGSGTGPSAGPDADTKGSGPKGAVSGGAAAPSGQTAVRPTVDDDGR